jgi:hypothetical protein
MSLSRKIAAAVEGLTATPGAPTAVAAEEGPHRLALEVGLAGPVGLEARGLEFADSGRPEWSLDELKDWGARLAARLTYLMEPLVVLEADAVAGAVELRSKSPTGRDGRRSYYRIRLDRRGTLRLDRVAYDESARSRRAVPMQLTREVLERLADDLVASVG